MTPTGRLSRLIREVFSADSIKVFIAENFDFEDDIDFNRSHRSIALKVAGHVWDARLEGPFLDAMIEERPARHDEIAETQRLLAEARRAERADDRWEPQGLLGVMRSSLRYEATEFTFGGRSPGWSVRSAADEVDADRAIIDLGSPPLATRSLPGPTRDANTGDGDRGPGLIPPDLEEVGLGLWTAIFSAEGANLAAALPKIQPQSGGRRIVFDLTNTPGLAQFPWECIQRPGRPPMGIDVKSTVIRLIDADEYVPAELEIPQPPLRLLIVTADSEHRDDFDFATEVARIGDTANIAIPEPVVDATFETLFKALRDQRPHILHFIGHGSAEGIELATNGSGNQLLDASALANLVGNNLQTLRLVFLNSCRGAAEVDPQSFTSAASRMIQAGLPAAVAMQYPISNEAAIELSEIFYSYVASGEEIDAAITQARSYLHGMGHPEWIAPALYMRRWQDGLALVGPPDVEVEEPVPAAVEAPTAAPPPVPVAEAVEAVEAVESVAPPIDLPAAAKPAAPPVQPDQPLAARVDSMPTALRKASRTAADGAGRSIPDGPHIDVMTPRSSRRLPLGVLLATAALALVVIGVLSIQNLGLPVEGSSTTEPATAASTTETTGNPSSTARPSTTTVTTTDSTDGSPVENPIEPVPVDTAGVAVAVEPGGDADVYVDGQLIDVGSGASVEYLDLSPGEYPVEIYEDSAAPPPRSDDRDDSPIVADSILVDGLASTVVIRPVDDGGVAIDTIEHDTGAIEAGSGRIELRNLSIDAPVEVSIDGDPLDRPVDPGGSTSITREAGRLTIGAVPFGGGDGPTTSIELEEGDLIVALVIDSSDQPGGLDLLIQHYSGLQVMPVGVDSGNSGLRAVEAGPWSASPSRSPAPPITSTNAQSRRPAGIHAGSVTPTAVRVGGVRLSAPVVPVGIDADGTVTVPEPDRAGWYRYGSLPGAAGSATLVAHVDYDRRPAAFFDLADVDVGDQVEVAMSDGAVERFVVTQRAYYDKAELPVGELFATTGPARLQLITCGGGFDSERRSYLGNVVVTALPIPVAGSPWSSPGGVE